MLHECSGSSEIDASPLGSGRLTRDASHPVHRVLAGQDNVMAFVGPFWGPDFQDIVLEALGLQVFSGQRTMLADTLYKRWR